MRLEACFFFKGSLQSLTTTSTKATRIVSKIFGTLVVLAAIIDGSSWTYADQIRRESVGFYGSFRACLRGSFRVYIFRGSFHYFHLPWKLPLPCFHGRLHCFHRSFGYFNQLTWKLLSTPTYFYENFRLFPRQIICGDGSITITSGLLVWCFLGF